jgi:hypothetical protein
MQYGVAWAGAENVVYQAAMNSALGTLAIALTPSHIGPIAECDAVSMSASEAQSLRTAITRSPSSCTAASSVCRVRPVISTRASCCVSSRAVSSPKPLLPPVITAVLFSY